MNRLWRNLPISHKLLVSSLVFAVPIALLLYFMVHSINKDIRFTQKEIDGSVVCRLLGQTMADVQRHRRVAYFFLYGDRELVEDLEQAAAEADRSWKRLLEASDPLAAALKLDPASLDRAGLADLSPRRLKEQWEELKVEMAAGDVSFIQSERIHDQLTRNLFELFTYVSQTSNLVLDPDLDTYYLMTITVQHLPRVQSLLGEVLITVTQGLQKQYFDWQAQADLAVSLAGLEETIASINRAAETALTADSEYYGRCPRFHENFPPVLERCNQAVSALIEYAEPMMASPTITWTTKEFLVFFQPAVASTSQLWQVGGEDLSYLLNERIDALKYRRAVALSLSLGTLALAAVIVWVIALGVTRPLGRITDIAGLVAQGRIAETKTLMESHRLDGARLSSKNEILRLTAAFDAMIHSLASLLNQVRQSGIKVTSTSTAISASTRQFESTVNQQAAATNQTAATSREISTRSHEANDEVEEATAMTAGTTELAEQGRRSLEVVETDMRRLMDAAGLINDKLGDISQNAAGISGIVETITKVADQTNLLSLNASIEAEKAGEYGLGFSVVAGEISRLADQTAVAAMDIEEMVAEMRETVAGGVREVEGFVEDFKSGVGEVNRINRQIADIIDRVKALEPKFEAVRAAVHAQSGGAEDISAAMGQLADSATQTKDSLDDLNQAAQDLAEAVRGLNQEVSRFEID